MIFIWFFFIFPNRPLSLLFYLTQALSPLSYFLIKLRPVAARPYGGATAPEYQNSPKPKPFLYYPVYFFALSSNLDSKFSKALQKQLDQVLIRPVCTPFFLLFHVGSELRSFGVLFLVLFRVVFDGLETLY